MKILSSAELQQNSTSPTNLRGGLSALSHNVEELIFSRVISDKKNIKLARINSHYNNLIKRLVVSNPAESYFEYYLKSNPHLSRFQNVFTNAFSLFISNVNLEEVQKLLTSSSIKIANDEMVECSSDEASSFIQRVVFLKKFISQQALLAYQEVSQHFQMRFRIFDESVNQKKWLEHFQEYFALIIVERLGQDNFQKRTESYQELTVLHYFASMGYYFAIQHLCGLAEFLQLSVDFPSQLGTPYNCAALAGDVCAMFLLKQQGAKPTFDNLVNAENKFLLTQHAAIAKQDDKGVYHPKANDFTKRLVLEFLTQEGYDIAKIRALPLNERREICWLLGLYIDDNLLNKSNANLSESSKIELWNDYIEIQLKLNSNNDITTSDNYQSYKQLKNSLLVFKQANEDERVFYIAFAMAEIVGAINSKKIEMVHCLRYCLSHFDMSQPISNKNYYRIARIAAMLLGTHYMRLAMDKNCPEYLDKANYYLQIAQGLSNRQLNYYRSIPYAESKELVVECEHAKQEINGYQNQLQKFSVPQRNPSAPGIPITELPPGVNPSYGYATHDFGSADPNFFKSAQKRKADSMQLDTNLDNENTSSDSENASMGSPSKSPKSTK